MWKKSEIKYKWIDYKYWIYYLIPTLVVFSILYCIHPNECPDNARYILSAISQGLAAILALVFTITLVVAQMTRRYTAMDKIVFRYETIILMIVFGIGIIVPLLVLAFGFWNWGVPLSIAIASFCVFSLLPFLIGVNRVLKYEIGFVNLYGETLDAIKLENEANVVKGIIDLESICIGAIKESRENTTSGIIHFLSEIGKKIIETKLKTATGNLIIGLGNIGIDAIEKGFKDATLFFLAGALSDLRIGAAENTCAENAWEQEALLATYKLKEIGCKAAEKKLTITTDKAIGGLKYCDSVDGGTEFNHEAVRGLCYLGVFTTEYLPFAVDHVIKILEEFDRSIILYSMGGLEKSFVEEYPHLKTSLDKFKSQCPGWQ